ncbi:hypothetical protein BU24DRAFT_419123 [Aaosphaeria arxii CBS 175.79]|uniref:Uncharacterized protein n=1 Tax=Aaosphaeria arxii CBS 175.79 TaxID=1450172 RepID=A0A6A5Y2N0_9PLEO|nr:uncharacterized protein BU24DRAFT_419123 [Aaosphaeria arxii CBS 175.79]KAF2019509.1 hypothetical protein BU24DRAFT_419123 [Aaosphaeria arxii CBS 175.79]
MLPSTLIIATLGALVLGAPTPQGASSFDVIPRSPSSNQVDFAKRMIIVAAEVDQTEEFDEDEDSE